MLSHPVFSKDFDNFHPKDFEIGDTVTVVTKTNGNITGVLCFLKHKDVIRTEAIHTVWDRFKFFRASKKELIFDYHFWQVFLAEPKGQTIKIRKSGNFIVLNDPINILSTKISLVEKSFIHKVLDNALAEFIKK